MDFVVQEISQPVDAVIGREVGEMDPEDVVEDGVVRLPDRVHVLDQQRLTATQTPRDVDVPPAISVEPQREERAADVVRRDGRHPGPLQARRQALVDPGVVGGYLQVAVEGAGHLRQEGAGHRLPPCDRVRHPGWGRRCGHLRKIVPHRWLRSGAGAAHLAPTKRNISSTTRVGSSVGCSAQSQPGAEGRCRRAFLNQRSHWSHKVLAASCRVVAGVCVPLPMNVA